MSGSPAIPFGLGQTYYGTGGTIPSTPTQSKALVGFTGTFFEDWTHSGNYAAGPRARETQEEVDAILVRNAAGVNLLPGRVAKWEDEVARTVGGYTTLTAEYAAGVIDPRLPSAGVRDGDLFWLIRRGPCLLKTALEGDANNVINAGDILYALTAATSQAITAGRVQPWAGTQTSTSTTDGTGSKIVFNNFARALSAKTTANTNADLLARVNFYR
jgi:hypothetical protein